MHSLSEGINIRNFKIQVPRYALLSDMIIYAKDGEQDLNILQLAKQISAAQEEVFRAMKEQYPAMSPESRRQTFVLTESFAAFETKYPELVAISSNGRSSKNKVDFWEQEREQMSLLTRGSEIAPGIWLGNSSDVPQQNNGNNASSSLATPVSPGASFQSYFFPTSSTTPSTTIPNTLSQAASSTIPTTPPPETSTTSNEDYYPPLTPPSFSDQTNFHPSICIECRSGANAPTTFTLDRIKSNVVCTPAPLSFKEIFHLECGGSLTAGVNPEAFPPSTSSLSNFARQENPDVSANGTMRRATAAGLAGGYQMVNTMLQTQITHLVNMAFFINQVTNSPDGASASAAAAIAASGLSSPTSPSSPPSSFMGGRRSPSTSSYQQQRPAHQVLIHCVDGYTETALLALSTLMVHYRFTLAEAYVKMQTDLGRSFFVYPNDAIMMLEVEAQIWQRLVSEKSDYSSSTSSRLSKGGVGMSAVPNSASSFASSLSSSSSGMSSLSSSLSSTSSSFFSSLLNMTNQPSPQDQLQQQDTTIGGNMSMDGIESTPDPKPITPVITTISTTKTNNNATVRPFARQDHLEKFSWFYHPEFEGSFPSRILPFLYLGNLAHASNPGLLQSLGIQYVLSVGEEAHGLNVHIGEVGGSAGNVMKETQFMVKLVDDMFDNGVDPLWRHIENCVAFVVIAYLMAHYNLSLVDAYLLVRARRLSVIIQPNLLFMYELLQWEQRLKGRFDSMGWPGVAREVHHLNMYYIGN
ncbi:tyrosine/serine/threonine protein phosphatase pps1 [Mortierella sp. AD032]|nr:tyrosine/serine/threonine protein phosphatase pps1 [Mortierella sp. AD032]